MYTCGNCSELMTDFSGNQKQAVSVKLCFYVLPVNKLSEEFINNYQDILNGAM